MSNFAVILMFFVLVTDVRVYAKNNDTVVSKITDLNSSHTIQPMMLINQHVPEKKGKILNKNMDQKSNEFAKNELTSIILQNIC